MFHVKHWLKFGEVNGERDDVSFPVGLQFTVTTLNRNALHLAYSSGCFWAWPS